MPRHDEHLPITDRVTDRTAVPAPAPLQMARLTLKMALVIEAVGLSVIALAHLFMA